MANILLLEPNRMLLRNYAEFLRAKGHEVAECEDAQHGVNEADNKRPDIVVVELMLAGHSGIEFLYEFRSYEEWLKVPVIIFTSLHKGEIGINETRLKELGVVAVLDKSKTTLDKLVTQINRALKLNEPV